MMSKTEEIGSLISECLDRCRASGYSLATLITFLVDLRASGQPEVDVQRVDAMMRHIMIELLAPGELPAAQPLSESPTSINVADTIKLPKEVP